MKFPAVRAFLRFPQLMLLMALVFSAPAWAQFEIAPDHFDANTGADKKHPAKAKSVKPENQAASLSAKTSEKHQAGLSQIAVGSGNQQTTNASLAAGGHTDTGKSPQSSGKTAATTARKRTTTKKVTLASTR